MGALFWFIRLIERDEQEEKNTDTHRDENVFLRRVGEKANQERREENRHRRSNQDVGRARAKMFFVWLFHLSLQCDVIGQLT